MRSASESTYLFRDVDTMPRLPKTVDVIANLVRSYLDWRKQQADIATLQGLSAPQLKDMGLYPEDIGRIASSRRFPLSIDPRF